MDMNSWETQQQALRIFMNAIGAFMTAMGASQSWTVMFSGLGLTATSVLWWWFWNRGRKIVPVIDTTPRGL